MPTSIEVAQASSPDLVALARELFREYEHAIGVDLEYQGFAAELAALPLPYAPPDGALLVATVGGSTAGCVALRRIGAHVCEMKRLYVRPTCRGMRLGERLVGEIIDHARRAGYQEIRLDTLPSMTSAQGLYRRLGFREIPAYNDAHLPGTLFFALALEGRDSQPD
ncbi:MAG: GNAT family N-acetyltransferase [Xanthomonadales bacterium]|nr:GNAT family N-acetyltransferase [Xanthomonadales bacterium]ODU92111.1 MAG: hypothetical protein ABT18_13630 [Rhodanobacter sp. SCN 66-43]OJY86025.1 MAG: hypothetical protein BGP23_05060 [Xanthomonadales bacterium 66-474]